MIEIAGKPKLEGRKIRCPIRYNDCPSSGYIEIYGISKKERNFAKYKIEFLEGYEEGKVVYLEDEGIVDLNDIKGGESILEQISKEW